MLVIGCGALGTAVAETLVRAGVRKLIIADRDYVEASNLQRQQLFTERDAIEGTPKVIAAERRLKEIRSDVEIATVLNHIDATLLEELVVDVSIIVDATDNFETRLLINDVAWKNSVPWIYGACVGSTSTMFPFVPGESACFRCLLPVLPAINETCDTAGIIAPAVQITAAHQSAEVLKYVSGNQASMRKKMMQYDCWNNVHVEAGISRMKNTECETCGNAPTYPSLEPATGIQYVVLCGRDTVQVTPEKDRKLTLSDVERVASRIDNTYKRTPYFIELIVDGYRCIIFANGRMLIHGMKDRKVGRNMYHRLFG